MDPAGRRRGGCCAGRPRPRRGSGKTRGARRAGSVGGLSRIPSQEEPREEAAARPEFLLPNEKSFQNAANSNNLDLMEKLFKKKVNINAGNNMNWIALHFAVGAKHLSAMDFLLNHKAQVDVADKNAETPFFLAIEGGHEECSKVLLAGGSDINIPNEEHGESIRDPSSLFILTFKQDHSPETRHIRSLLWKLVYYP
ncbi:Ankyrin Repeat And Death Domain-Containing Protein 1B [Manis pentadactyla]|nr:Ankyrin Repeat And Death Domain-Containing Protein 1B [Manis pentadactyla]